MRRWIDARTAPVDGDGCLVLSDASTRTELVVYGRPEIRSLPPLPQATWVCVHGCTGLTSLDLPQATRVDVRECTGLTSLDLPQATWVDVGGCTGLTSLDLPQATTVDVRGCTGLTSLDLPQATRVDVRGCTGLTSLDLPQATRVDVRECTGLTSLDLPQATWVYVHGCTGLTSLDLPQATTVSVRGCTGLTSLDLPQATLVSVRGCTGLTSLDLPALGDVPVVEHLASRVYRSASAPGALEMGEWHTCATTHCWAGWIVTLAGEAGAALEARSDTPMAAALIWLASGCGPGVPDFYASNEAALASMRAATAQHRSGA